MGNPGHDDEINIGFDANGDLETQAAISDVLRHRHGLGLHAGGTRAVNGNHTDQDVPSEDKPQIYNGTAVITEHQR